MKADKYIAAIKKQIAEHQQTQMFNPPTSDAWQLASTEIQRLAALIVAAQTPKVYECGNYSTPITSAEAVRGWVRCGACGKTIKIRPRRDNTAFVRSHDRPKK